MSHRMHRISRNEGSRESSPLLHAAPPLNVLQFIQDSLEWMTTGVKWLRGITPPATRTTTPCQYYCCHLKWIVAIQCIIFWRPRTLSSLVVVRRGGPSSVTSPLLNRSLIIISLEPYYVSTYERARNGIIKQPLLMSLLLDYIATRTKGLSLTRAQDLLPLLLPWLILNRRTCNRTGYSLGVFENDRRALRRTLGACPTKTLWDGTGWSKCSVVLITLSLFIMYCTHNIMYCEQQSNEIKITL